MEDWNPKPLPCGYTFHPTAIDCLDHISGHVRRPNGDIVPGSSGNYGTSVMELAVLSAEQHVRRDMRIAEEQDA